MRRRPIRARNLQRRDDPIRAIAEKHQPALARAIFAAFRALQDHVSEHLARIQKAPPPTSNTARQILSPEAVSIAIETATADMTTAATEAAQSVLEQAAITAGIAPEQQAAGILTAAVHVALSQYRADLVQQVTQDTIDAITAQVQAGLNAGERFDVIAARVKPLIGLTSQQMAAVDSFRTALENLDTNALTRAWRSTQYDDVVRAAIETETNLTADQIDSQVATYALNALAGRATLIARTESLRAANIGAKSGIQAFLDSRGFDQSNMLRFWLTAMDELVCPICSAIPDDNADGVAMDDYFDTDLGPVDYPPVHPNCRCTVVHRLDPQALQDWREAQGIAA